jgi:epoxyqueuosine reductase QueG
MLKEEAMGDLSSAVIRELTARGADLIGIGDLTALPEAQRCGLPFGIAVAVKYPKEVIRGIADGPTRDYFDQYHMLNQKLDELVTLGARLLTEAGYHASAQTRAFVQQSEADYSTTLPHKTVATRAGLGWIGKCALLVTREFGSAVRISSLLTDAPLTPSAPVDASQCGGCTACTRACPAGAVSGNSWSPGLPRDAFFNAHRCRETAREISGRRLGEVITLCGKCIEVCPHTRRYLDAP